MCNRCPNELFARNCRIQTKRILSQLKAMNAIKHNTSTGYIWRGGAGKKCGQYHVIRSWEIECRNLPIHMASVCSEKKSCMRAAVINFVRTLLVFGEVAVLVDVNTPGTFILQNNSFRRIKVVGRSASEEDRRIVFQRLWREDQPSGSADRTDFTFCDCERQVGKATLVASAAPFWVSRNLH
eukprot:TRINITY_DN11417_c0_g1_i1.p1 TRINITY_DN11417_c0_g1~~TRINITY_DN11417_c0_g1_i1.p1  ORF type:complete len:182 (-),score=2.34 TRINITY_DN11417_c0_g1_i1:244-789(-)